MILYHVILVSCSSNELIKSNSYLSPSYIDKSFNNAFMDICYINSKYEYNYGLDSNTVSMMINFDESFRKYFADGIKMFSSINKVGWIFYDYDNNYNIIEYKAKTKDGEDFFIFLDDSLSFFQKKSNSDFLFIVHNITVMQNGPMQSNKNTVETEDYEFVEPTHWALLPEYPTKEIE